MSPQIAPTRLRRGAKHFVGREADLERLDKAWVDPKTHILAIVAWGGAGKTSLVVEWMARRAASAWPGCERVFDWSFYDQGTNTNNASSSDQFIAAALAFFGGEDGKHLANSPASYESKGTKLAEYVVARPSLLVLDGLEPLQTLGGMLPENDALPIFLRCLAQQAMHGLCIVTTRVGIVNLDPWMNNTVAYLGELEQAEGNYPQLSSLSTDQAIALLRTLGVHGPKEDFMQLVHEVNGHALTLNLLGTYITRAHRGDIRHHDRIKFRQADGQVQGGHAFRVIASYVKLFKRSGKDGLRMLAVLRLLGLFDRPADSGCLAALRREPAILGLTEALIDLGDDDWNITLSAISDLGLISFQKIDETQFSLDTHPLIREFFAEQFRTKYPDAWCLAHHRLYEYLRDNTPDKPQPTLDDLQPLYQAVTHACHAGGHEKALRELYLKRIQRGEAYYSTTKLGGFSSTLAAMRGFFDEWGPNWIPKAGLQDSSRATVLLNTGYCLRALVKLPEASKCFEAALSVFSKMRNYSQSAIVAGMLSVVYSFQGELPKAFKFAEKGIGYADKSKDQSLRMNNRSIYAHLFIQTGDLATAEEYFKVVNKLRRQCANSSDRNRLATSVIRWCMFLETKKKYAEIQREAETMLNILRKPPERENIYCGMLNWCLGRALFAQGRLSNKPKQVERAIQMLQNALGCFQQGAGILLEQPRVYLALAECYCFVRTMDAAAMALNKAWEIAAPSRMRLHLADIHISRAHLFFSEKAYPWENPQTDLATAEKLIHDCGYHRRDKELAAAKKIIFRTHL
ncbi:MAG: hypothetical protein WCO56_15585 [Verrucomicrobiota bacterium]